MAKAKPAVNDPIEGAKLEEIAKPPDAPPEAPPAPAVAEAPPVEVIPVVVKKYRVKAKTTVSLNGQLLVLAADDILSAESYGPIGMQRLIDAGVPLEELS